VFFFFIEHAEYLFNFFWKFRIKDKCTIIILIIRHKKNLAIGFNNSESCAVSGID